MIHEPFQFSPFTHSFSGVFFVACQHNLGGSKNDTITAKKQPVYYNSKEVDGGKLANQTNDEHNLLLNIIKQRVLLRKDSIKTNATKRKSFDIYTTYIEVTELHTRLEIHEFTFEYKRHRNGTGKKPHSLCDSTKSAHTKNFELDFEQKNRVGKKAASTQFPKHARHLIMHQICASSLKAYTITVVHSWSASILIIVQ